MAIGSGILAGRHHLTPGPAFAMLRRHARSHNRPLTCLAGDVICGNADFAGSGQRRASHEDPAYRLTSRDTTI
ncbi:MAG: ANTAR domain-containing protein [Streptosporangiaceae bacterium]